MKLIWSLVEQSLSEADYLWTQLDESFDTPARSFADVEAWVEPRLLGALDGVRVAGTAAVEPLLRDSIRDLELGVASVAAYALSMLSDPGADRVIEQAVREVSYHHGAAYVRGLGRAARVPALHALWERLNDASGSARAVVLDALSFCGQAPDADWKSLLDDAEPRLRAAAASALRFASPLSIERYVHFACDTSDTEARNRALTAGVAAGSGSAWRRCLHYLKAPDRRSGPLLLLAATLGTDRELSRVIEARREPELGRDAVWALGFAGTVPAIEACLDQMRAGEHVRVAAEAVCAITGLDLRGEQLSAGSGPLEDDAELPLEEDDLDANLVLGGDDLLLAPDVAGVEQWWNRHRVAYAGDQRYLAGRPRTLRGLRSALQHGPTRRRAALALELAARSAGACVVQPLAFCRQQRQALERFAALHPNALQNAARSLGIATLSES
jgi:uncharacterized protein (TIGR02270 family)